MKTEAIVCDVCGTVKRETNHWFIGAVNGTGVHLYPAGAVEWSGVDLCGEECLHKWITAKISVLKESDAKNQPTPNV